MSMNFLREAASGKPVVPPPFELSPVERTYSAWRYLWPYQSRKALVWTLCIHAGGALAFALVILLWLDPGALPWALGGGLIGGLYMGPHRVLPAKMTITTRSEARHQVDDVKRLLLRIGYVVGKPTDEAGHVHYLPRIAAKWPLTHYPEQDMDLRWRDHQIELHGPVSMVELLHRQLHRQLEA